MQTIRLTACYGDISVNKPWNKSISSFLKDTASDLHIVGGDFNRSDLFHNVSDSMSYAVTQYVNTAKLFYDQTVPTFQDHVLDYLMISKSLHNILPLTSMDIQHYTDIPLQMGVKFDHKILSLTADTLKIHQKFVPMLCRHWHKRDVSSIKKRSNRFQCLHH